MDSDDLGSSKHGGAEECHARDDQAPARVTLILVGRSGAGKSTSASGLAARTGRPVIEIGDIVRKDAAEQGLQPLEHARRTFKAGDGTHFVRRAVSDAGVRGTPGIVVGPRMAKELAFLRHALRPTLAIGLLIPDVVRCQRLALRSKDFVLQEQMRREDVEEGWGIARTLASCDSFVHTTADRRSVVSNCLNQWLKADLRHLHASGSE